LLHTSARRSSENTLDFILFIAFSERQYNPLLGGDLLHTSARRSSENTLDFMLFIAFLERQYNPLLGGVADEIAISPVSLFRPGWVLIDRNPPRQRPKILVYCG